MVDYLLIKCKILSSNPNTSKEERKGREGGKEGRRKERKRVGLVRQRVCNRTQEVSCPGPVPTALKLCSPGK
jgi:hypothetical protein